MRLITLKFIFFVFSISSSYAQSITLLPVAIKSLQANSSGLQFINMNSNTPAAASNNNSLSVDGLGNVILISDSQAYWQISGNTLVNANSGIVKINQLQVGNNSSVIAGTIRWTGNDFEVYNGTAWKSLTGVSSQEIWMSVDGCNTGQGCTTVCPTGYQYAPTAAGYVCKDQSGQLGTSYYSNGTTVPCNMCGSGGRLSQCHCVKK